MTMYKIKTEHPGWSGRQIGLNTKYYVRRGEGCIYVEAPSAEVLIKELVRVDSDFVPALSDITTVSKEMRNGQ